MTFTANADSDHILELETDGGVVDTAATVANNDFDTAAAPNTTDDTINSLSIDGLIDSTIQGAINSTADGATVDVVAGTYEEDVKVGKSITLSGAGAEQTTIVGQNDRPGALFVSSDHPGTQVTGFRVESGGSSNAVHLSSGSEITDVTFTQNTFVGADGQATAFVGGDHENVDFDGNTFTAADGAEPIEHLYVGGEASYGSGAESATSAEAEDDITGNTFEGTISRDGSGNAIEFEGQHGEVTGNSFSEVTTDGATVAVPGSVADGNEANIENINGETTQTNQLLAIIENNEGVTATDPAVVTDVNLTNPSGKALELSVVTNDEISSSSLVVELGGETAETGTDLTLSEDEFTRSENDDGTYTYTGTATAAVASGSSATYRASIAELEGDTNTGALPASQQLRVAVQQLDEGSGTVETGSETVPEATITLSEDSDTEVTVASTDDVPATGDQSKEALASDVEVVDEEDEVTAALNINVDEAVADSSATLEFTVSRDDVGSDPTNLVVTHYYDGSYEATDTSVVTTDEETITLEADTSGFSPFVIVETDESPAEAPEEDSEDTGVGGGGGSSASGVFAVDDTSVTERISMDPVQEVTVDFEEGTTGTVQIETVDGFPSGAPTPEGQVLSTVDISPPDEAAEAPGSVELTVSRTAISDAGAEPSELRIVRYNRDSGELETLTTNVVSEDDQTVVLSADTPGFSVFGVVVSDQMAATATPTATATPEPASTSSQTESGGSAATATAEPTATEPATETGTPTESGGPGFGAIVAIIALIAAALLATRRDS